MRALLFLCGVAVGLLARPTVDALHAEARELSLLYDREVERWFAHFTDPRGAFDA